MVATVATDVLSSRELRRLRAGRTGDIHDLVERISTRCTDARFHMLESCCVMLNAGPEQGALKAPPLTSSELS